MYFLWIYSFVRRGLSGVTLFLFWRKFIFIRKFMTDFRATGFSFCCPSLSWSSIPCFSDELLSYCDWLWLFPFSSCWELLWLNYFSLSIFIWFADDFSVSGSFEFGIISSPPASCSLFYCVKSLNLFWTSWISWST